MAFVRSCWFALVERLLHWAPHPKIRARLLALLGASVGQDVRVECVQFTGLWRGFGGLTLADGAFIGAGCVLDLTGDLAVGQRAAISPGCVLMTHADPGSMTGNKLSDLYERKVAPITIGADAWVGAHSTILCGVSIGEQATIGAGAVVITDVPSNAKALGVPAKVRDPRPRFQLSGQLQASAGD